MEQWDGEKIIAVYEANFFLPSTPLSVRVSNKRNFDNSTSCSIRAIFSDLKWFDPRPTFHPNGLSAHLLVGICRLNSSYFAFRMLTAPVKVGSYGFNSLYFFVKTDIYFPWFLHGYQKLKYLNKKMGASQPP
ncbi:MAG: hypothetical protein ACJASQ_003305 [Crocinitomicaceae bacterium]